MAKMGKGKTCGPDELPIQAIHDIGIQTRMYNGESELCNVFRLQFWDAITFYIFIEQDVDSRRSSLSPHHFNVLRFTLKIMFNIIRNEKSTFVVDK